MREPVLARPRAGGSPNVGLAAATGFVTEFARAIVDELEPRLAEHIASALETVRAPRLLDRRSLAEALGCSVDTVDRLRREGCPELMIGDSPRYEFDRVIEHLREKAPK